MNLTTVISRRRGEVMGCAILLIMLFHTYTPLPSAAWRFIVGENGNIGVDFFVFLAGFGCAFSLIRSPDIGAYYGRRLKRVLPPYYVAMVLCILLSGLPAVEQLLAYLIPVGVWVGHDENYWYISASLVYYLLVPLLLALILRARWPRIMYVTLLGCFSLAIPYVSRNHWPYLAVMRLPSLVAGVAMGAFHHTHSRRRDRWIDILLLAALGLAALAMLRHPRLLTRRPFPFLNKYQARRLRRTLCAPPLAALIALALEGIGRTPLRFVNAPLRAMGRHSLGLYLANPILRYFGVNCLRIGGWWNALFVLALSYPLGLLIEWGGRGLLALLRKMRLLNAPSSGSPPA